MRAFPFLLQFQGRKFDAEVFESRGHVAKAAAAALLLVAAQAAAPTTVAALCGVLPVVVQPVAVRPAAVARSASNSSLPARALWLARKSE